MSLQNESRKGYSLERREYNVVLHLSKYIKRIQALPSSHRFICFVLRPLGEECASTSSPFILSYLINSTHKMLIRVSSEDGSIEHALITPALETIEKGCISQTVRSL